MSPSDAPESDEPYWATACFSFGDLHRLDREGRLLGTVETGHHRVELLADLETLRTLLVAVAAEVAALDEAGCAVVTRLHFQTTVGDRENGDGNHRALV